MNGDSAKQKLASTNSTGAVVERPLHMGRKKSPATAVKKVRKQHAATEKKKKKDLEMKLKLMEKAEPEFVSHLRKEAVVQQQINNPPASSSSSSVMDLDVREPSSSSSSEEEEEGEDPFGTSHLYVPQLEEWDPLSLPENFFLALEGKRRTGKTTFAKWLLQYYQNRFQLVWVMTRTRSSGFWQKMVGSDFTFSDYNPAAISRIVKRNDAIIEKYGTDSPLTKLKASTLIILDDVISAKIHDDPMFTLMACEGRHHKLSIILMTQDPKAIGPKVRDNADVAVVFNQKTFRNKESCWHDFMNDVDKLTAFALLGQYAAGHCAVVCNQTNLTGEIRRNFYKTTGDKTKLDDPEYILGGVGQRTIVLKERKEKENLRPIKEMTELAEIKELQRSGVQFAMDQDPAKFTVEEVRRPKVIA
jgi:hypothetical protein